MFKPTGPKNAKIAIVGEACGREEEKEGKPFVGSAGQELDKLLLAADIDRAECYITNVFHERPPSTATKQNDIGAWCVGAKEIKAAAKDGTLDQRYEVWATSKMRTASPMYLAPERYGALDRLEGELQEVQPNVVIALGNTAAWALLGMSGISKLRGAVTESVLIPGLKVMPTFHPAMFLYDDEKPGSSPRYSWRMVTVRDLMKAQTEAASPSVELKKREITIYPQTEDIPNWVAEHVEPGKMLSVDIETGAGQITCIGFGADELHSLVIPFMLEDRTSYWQTEAEEIYTWGCVKGLLEDETIPKLFQNGSYDIQWLAGRMGIMVSNYRFDTMVLHHALYSELPKSLEFLGSVYTNERSWKNWKPKRMKVSKKDD